MKELRDNPRYRTMKACCVILRFNLGAKARFSDPIPRDLVAVGLETVKYESSACGLPCGVISVLNAIDNIDSEDGTPLKLVVDQKRSGNESYDVGTLIELIGYLSSVCRSKSFEGGITSSVRLPLQPCVSLGLTGKSMFVWDLS